jgi:hypothetical protein
MGPLRESRDQAGSTGTGGKVWKGRERMMIQKGRAHLQRESPMRRDRHYGGTFNCKSGGVQLVRIRSNEV